MRFGILFFHCSRNPGWKQKSFMPQQAIVGILERPDSESSVSLRIWVVGWSSPMGMSRMNFHMAILEFQSLYGYRNPCFAAFDKPLFVAIQIAGHAKPLNWRTKNSPKMGVLQSRILLGMSLETKDAVFKLVLVMILKKQEDLLMFYFQSGATVVSISGKFN